MGLIDFNRDLDDLIEKAQKAKISAEDIRDALESAAENVEDDEEEEEKNE